MIEGPHLLRLRVIIYPTAEAFKDEEKYKLILGATSQNHTNCVFKSLH